MVVLIFDALHRATVTEMHRKTAKHSGTWWTSYGTRVAQWIGLI